MELITSLMFIEIASYLANHSKLILIVQCALCVLTQYPHELRNKTNIMLFLSIKGDAQKSILLYLKLAEGPGAISYLQRTLVLHGFSYTAKCKLLQIQTNTLDLWIGFGSVLISDFFYHPLPYYACARNFNF